MQNVVSDLFNEIPNEVYKGQTLIGSNSRQVNLNNALIIDNGEDIEIKIIFNNKLRNCLYMFYQLKNITFIDLSLFDISEVSTMSNMFYGCHSLTSIVFGKIGASKVEDLGGIFNECGSLREINLSKFDTSLVTNMGGMFADCYLLTSLNLSNFNTTNVEAMNSMFNNCSSLASLDLSSFQTSKVSQFSSMFAHDKSLTSLNLSNFETSQATLMERMFYDCINLEYINLDKATQMTSLSEYANFDMIFMNVPLNLVICIHTFERITSQLPDLKHYANDCSENWKNSVKKKRVILDNTYVDQCNGSSPYEFENKCYQNCPDFTNDDNQDFICEKNNYIKIQTTELNYYIIEKTTEYIYKFIDINETIQNILKNKTLENDENKIYDKIIEIVELILTSENFDTSYLDQGEDQIIEMEKMKIILTTAQNQKKNLYNNKTIVDLGECETLIRNNYNLSDNEILYIKMFDVKKDGMKISKIEFDVYCKLFGTNLTKLDVLSTCGNNRISISIPIGLSENLDKLNISSGYFNDLCYSSTSDIGTDISLNDRKIYFIENNKTVCQEDCLFSDYNSSIQKVNCSCHVKEASKIFANIYINKSKLYENFGSTNNKIDISNLAITSCDIFSSKENIESNAGFFSLLVILVIFIIIFIIFCMKGYNLLENKIDDIIYKKFKSETHREKGKIRNSIKAKNIKILSKKPVKSENKIKKKNRSSSLFSNSKNKSISKNPFNRILTENNSKINEILKIPELKPETDYELNWLSYDEAIKFDKRSNCEYYCSLIKSKQLFLFTFCSFDDYNSGIVKKFILFLSFALHYTVNALFFTELNIHQIYKDEGKYNFRYQLSYILYSALASTFILRMILQFLVLTDKDIVEVKQQQSKNLAINMKKIKLKCMKIKFAIFFILIFILLGLFWYYLTCFNAIYQNTQIYLIKNTFISLAFSLFYPFIINIFPSVIRMCSLHSSNKNKNYFYRLSQIIQIF